MATEVVMPQMGESIAEGTITKWLVKVGEKVERDQPLFEISTDKVDAEIPSPASGTLLEIRHQEGETVPVNAVVAMLGGEGETAGEAAPAPEAPKPAEEKPAPAAPAPAAPTPAPAASAAAPAAAGSLEERVRTLSSPLVRNIAKKEGVDLAQVPGTGIHGRVTKADILDYLEKRKAGTLPAAAPAAIPVAAAAPSGKVDTGFHVPAYTPSENVVIEPMSKIRQITAAHMRYSKDTSAHVTTVFHMDFTRVHAARERAKRKFQQANGTKLSYMPFIFKAVAEGLKSNPKLNAAIDGTNVVFKKDVNLGMAVALDWGLLVPVIRNADTMNLIGLAKTANDLADRARSKKLSPDELKGGTFTITNPGVFGSLFGTPIINQPQVAILGIGTIEKRPMVMTDADGCDTIAIRTMSYFGITYDHRLVDGADADHFMNAVKKALEQGAWPELEPYS
ncbi:MAG: 2-oxoglutarate dehydrogenase, E2 component, dihydrolipoamide succinyltransferase [Holophagales bacterium]|nr:2-oxoglutarate dehydrogenase, E2 component, dihydrolipoamide succinyltransferase [Holophagales bacterium]